MVSDGDIHTGYLSDISSHSEEDSPETDLPVNQIRAHEDRDDSQVGLNLLSHKRKRQKLSISVMEQRVMAQKKKQEDEKLALTIFQS